MYSKIITPNDRIIPLAILKQLNKEHDAMEGWKHVQQNFEVLDEEDKQKLHSWVGSCKSKIPFIGY